MGLDIEVIKPEIQFDFRAGSYSGFDKFRVQLAKAVGIELYEMRGFSSKLSPKEWESDTPFIELLSHSDCDGTLDYDECVSLYNDFDFWKMDLELVDDKDFQNSVTEWREALKIVVLDRDCDMYIKFC